MIIKFNPTGTHVHKDRLKIRLDFYPDPTDKTYAQQYVDEVVWDEEKQETVPTGAKQLNPCLCHFLIIDTDITAQKLTDKIQELFPKDVVVAIDSALSDGNRQAFQALINPRCGSGKIVYGDPSNAINQVLSAVQVEV